MVYRLALADHVTIPQMTSTRMGPSKALAQSEPPVKILGAGPSGLAAAITLARGGRRVVVHERRRVAGGRFHDDFQGLENWSSDTDVVEELAGAGIRFNFDCTPVFHGTIYDARMRPALVRSRDPLVYLVRRGRQPGSLDSGLAEQALEAGVELRFGS